ncbi:MAG TPA: hypothetical protein VHI93_01360 [Candidatus Thermoplasmatota archaeon]|nr:hypothetical protein [Candidatus Thermoplasmatota archaeon]
MANGFCPHDQWPAICGEPECVEKWRNAHGFHAGGCSGRHSWHDDERFCILDGAA